MAAELTKGRSPFYPDQPVPVELFVGRQEQINYLITRGAIQVANGKPVSFFVQGEYGIGKSSIAGFVQRTAERSHGLHGIYVSLGGVRTLDALAAAVLEATVRSGAYEQSRAEKVRDWLGKYIEKGELFGVTVNVDAIRQAAPQLSSERGILQFLSEVIKRLEPVGVRGITLVLDEINGIAGNPDFARFLKGLVDSNALSPDPVPLMLVACGVADRRAEMIHHHESIDRVFDVVDIHNMSDNEVSEFYNRAFQSVHYEIDNEALSVFTHFANGLPKIMHTLGNTAYFNDSDGIIDRKDAVLSVAIAADEIGRKYVDAQVIEVLRSSDYRSILAKLGEHSGGTQFRKKEIVEVLTQSEKTKFDNFLQRMKTLRVLRQGHDKGEWVFINRMVGLYIFFKGSESRKTQEPKSIESNQSDS